jgi:serine/threonine protein kinase
MLPPPSVTITLGFIALFAALVLPVIRTDEYRRNLATVVAGGDPRFLRSTHDRVRFTSTGVLVVLTALAAGASIVAALCLLNDRESATTYIPVGLIWTAIVFSIDRWIVSTVDHGVIEDNEQPERPLLRAAAWTTRFLVRLAMSCVIGLLISEPILLWIYRDEIAAQIAENQQDAIDTQKASMTDNTNAQINALNTDPNGPVAIAQHAYDTAVATEDTKRRIYICEKDPTPACMATFPPGTITGDRGDGPQTQQAYTVWQSALGQLTTATDNLNRAAADRDAHIARLQTAADDAIEQITQTVHNDDGLLARERALNDIVAKDPSLNLRVWLVRGAILLIDILPLLLATFSPRTLYHRLERAEAIRQVRTATRDAEEGADAHLAQRRADRAKILAGTAADIEEATAAAESRKIAAYESTAAAAWQAARADAERRAEFDPTAPDPEPRDVPDETAPKSSSGTVPNPETSEAPGAPTDPADATFSAQQQRMVVGNRWEILQPLPDVSHSTKYPPYLARDLHGTRKEPVIVKIIAEAPGRGDDRSLRRALNEMAMPVGELHPNLAEIIDADIDPIHGCFVVTPFYPMTLQSWLNDPNNADRLTLLQVLTWTHQLLAGLDEAWRRGIVHLDVKPANIGLTPDLQIKLFDFGLMQKYRQPDAEYLTTDLAKFTAFYAPPEQVRRERGWITRAADLYAVGATVYRMLTGRPPLWLEARTAGLIDDHGYPVDEQARVLLRSLVANQPPQPLRRLLPQLPEPIADLVMRWLKAEASDRNPGNGRGFTQRLQLQLQACIREAVADGTGGMLVGHAFVERITLKLSRQWRDYSAEDRPRRRSAPWTPTTPDDTIPEEPGATMPEDPITYIPPDRGQPTDPLTGGYDQHQPPDDDDPDLPGGPKEQP